MKMTFFIILFIILNIVLFTACATNSSHIDTVVVVEGEFKDCIGRIVSEDVGESFITVSLRCPKDRFHDKVVTTLPIEYVRGRTLRGGE